MLSEIAVMVIWFVFAVALLHMDAPSAVKKGGLKSSISLFNDPQNL